MFFFLSLHINIEWIVEMYSFIQVVDEIFDKFAASRMGIDRTGQVVLMIHCGSRGFGHQVCKSWLALLSSQIQAVVKDIGTLMYHNYICSF